MGSFAVWLDVEEEEEELEGEEYSRETPSVSREGKKLRRLGDSVPVAEAADGAREGLDTKGEALELSGTDAPGGVEGLSGEREDEGEAGAVPEEEEDKV